MFTITEHVAQSERHRTFYLACGATDATPIVFVHGWPELSISWRHQLPCFGALGFRAIAPDMRGYGRSSVYARHDDYALEHIVRDMIELLDALGREQAIWVGHDWGSPVVWSLASHHPQRCFGVASLCVPYIGTGFAPGALLPLVDRALYPEATYRRKSSSLSTSASRGRSGACPDPPNQPPSRRTSAVRDGLPFPPGWPLRKRAFTVLATFASNPARAVSKRSS